MDYGDVDPAGVGGELVEEHKHPDGLQQKQQHGDHQTAEHKSQQILDFFSDFLHRIPFRGAAPTGPKLGISTVSRC